MTENHNYNIPEEGTEDWHVLLNENFEQFDTDIEIRDAEVDKGDYVPKEGAKFFATDTGRRFLGDGSQWIEAPPQPLTNLEVPQTTTDPSDGTPGEIWYREDTDTLKVQLANDIESLADGTGGTDDSDSDTTTETHRLEIVPNDGADWDTYTIVIDGQITHTENLDDGDTITTQDDGTVLIEGGIMGGKDPEAFEFEGTLESLTLSVDATAVLDGEAIDPANY